MPSGCSRAETCRLSAARAHPLGFDVRPDAAEPHPPGAVPACGHEPECARIDAVGRQHPRQEFRHQRGPHPRSHRRSRSDDVVRGPAQQGFDSDRVVQPRVDSHAHLGPSAASGRIFSLLSHADPPSDFGNVGEHGEGAVLAVPVSSRRRLRRHANREVPRAGP